MFQSPNTRWINGFSFDPSGRWLVAGHAPWATFWPLRSDEPFVFRGDGRVVGFTPDGKSLVTSGPDFTRVRALVDGGEERELPYGIPSLYSRSLRLDPESRFLLGLPETSVMMVPLDGSEPIELDGEARIAALREHLLVLRQRTRPVVDQADLELGTDRALADTEARTLEQRRERVEAGVQPLGDGPPCHLLVG